MKSGLLIAYVKIISTPAMSPLVSLLYCSHGHLSNKGVSHLLNSSCVSEVRDGVGDLPHYRFSRSVNKITFYALRD